MKDKRPEEKVIAYLKGTVQQKLRWVKSGINR
jgi:hypothetical protein